MWHVNVVECVYEMHIKTTRLQLKCRNGHTLEVLFELAMYDGTEWRRRSPWNSSLSLRVCCAALHVNLYFMVRVPRGVPKLTLVSVVGSGPP